MGRAREAALADACNRRVRRACGPGWARRLVPVNGSGRGRATPAADSEPRLPVPAAPAATPSPAPAAADRPRRSFRRRRLRATAGHAGRRSSLGRRLRDRRRLVSHRGAGGRGDVDGQGRWGAGSSRATGGWQQVIAGPFPSREDAEANRARLDRAGLRARKSPSRHADVATRP